MKRKIALLLALCVGVMLCLCACHIEDKNGPDDYSLVEITEDKLINGSSSYTETNSIINKTKNSVELSCEKFSGVRTIKKITFTGGKWLEINYDLELDGGNFRAVLIHDGEIVRDLPIGEDQKIIINNPKSSYEIRIAGESADFEIELEYYCVDTSDC